MCGSVAILARQRSKPAISSRSASRGFGFISSVALERGGGFGWRNALFAGVVQHLHGGVAEAALGHVDDALEGEVVGRGCVITRR